MSKYRKHVAEVLSSGGSYSLRHIVDVVSGMEGGKGVDQTSASNDLQYLIKKGLVARLANEKGPYTYHNTLPGDDRAQVKIRITDQSVIIQVIKAIHDFPHEKFTVKDIYDFMRSRPETKDVNDLTVKNYLGGTLVNRSIVVRIGKSTQNRVLYSKGTGIVEMKEFDLGVVSKLLGEDCGREGSCVISPQPRKAEDLEISQAELGRGIVSYLREMEEKNLSLVAENKALIEENFILKRKTEELVSGPTTENLETELVGLRVELENIKSTLWGIDGIDTSLPLEGAVKDLFQKMESCRKVCQKLLAENVALKNNQGVVDKVKTETKAPNKTKVIKSFGELGSVLQKRK